jgi:rod shape-determining protein MreC
LIRDTTSSRVLLGGLLAATLGLAAFDARSAEAASVLHPVRVFTAGIFGPMESGVVQVTRPVVRAVSDVGATHALAARVDSLRAANLDLAEQLRSARQAAAAAGEQAGPAAVAREAAISVRPAHVIAVAPEPGSWTVAIDTGTDQGVAPENAVLDRAGLVGRVTSVTADTATVLLLVDPISSVGVRSATTGQVGTLTGTGDELCRLVMFDQNVVPAVGEELRTFGSRDARPYAAGIPVGTVVAVKRQADGVTILVRPYTGLGSLDAVGVVVPDTAASGTQSSAAAPDAEPVQ